MKTLKRIIIGLVILVLLLVIVVRLVLHESRPTVIESNADQLANKILLAVNKESWDFLKYVQWSFPRGHHYVWDRPNNKIGVSWEDFVVHLDMNAVDGKAYKGDVVLEGEDNVKAVQEAWSLWCNDSFWLTAPFKVFDPGTTRQLAVDAEGQEGMLITYESGGITPGDQYLWFVDNQGLPTEYKMWVKILPIEGVYVSWVDYETLAGGSKLAQSHTLGLTNMQIDITDIKSGDNWSDLGFDTNPIKL